VLGDEEGEGRGGQDQRRLERERKKRASWLELERIEMRCGSWERQILVFRVWESLFFSSSDMTWTMELGRVGRGCRHAT